MVAARGTHIGLYDSDFKGVPLRKRVDDHFFTQANLGWSAASGGEAAFSNDVHPRHIVGRDATGRTHSVICPSVGSAVWTDPTTTTFDILGDAGALVTCTITGLVGESLTVV